MVGASTNRAVAANGVTGTLQRVVIVTRRLVRRVVIRLREDGCLRVAAALSFTTLLALVPFVTVVFSMMSLFPVFEQWGQALDEFMYRNFVPAVGEDVKSYLSQFTQQAGRLTAVGLVFLLISALLLLATIEDNFNEIWRVRKGRRFIQRLLAYWTVISLGPLLMMVSLSLTSYIFSLPVISTQPELLGVKHTLLGLLPWLFETVAFVLFYMAVPNCVVRFRDAFVGGLIATLLFELAKRGFALYVLNFKSYEVIYGALAAIPIFLIWVYLSWFIVLIGAHVTAVLPAAIDGAPPTYDEPPDDDE